MPWQPIETAPKDKLMMSQIAPIHNITMPGKVVSMSASGDNLYVICYVESPWWKFWKPRVYKQLVTLTAADMGILKPLA